MRKFMMCAAILVAAGCSSTDKISGPNRSENPNSTYLFPQVQLSEGGQYGDNQSHTVSYINRVIAPQASGLTGIAATLLNNCLADLNSTVNASPNKNVTAVIFGHVLNELDGKTIHSIDRNCDIIVR